MLMTVNIFKITLTISKNSKANFNVIILYDIKN